MSCKAALAVIREKARDELVAGKIFDRVVDDLLRPLARRRVLGAIAC